MKMTITTKDKKFVFMGEVKKLKKIVDVLMSMDHDEQWRTVAYLQSRLHDQRTISDVIILPKRGAR